MSNDCIFCKIVAGEIPCAKVYEDENVLSFLDIAPVNKGHALVVTKAHYEDLLSLPPEAGCGLLDSLQKVGKAVMKVTGADGFNLIQNNGTAAGQLVFHAHFHIIPRFSQDGLELWAQGSYDDGEMAELAAKIADQV
ncbi:MAG: HIT family protein [Desulfovibrio sp.]